MKQWQRQIRWGLYFWIGASIFTCFVYAQLDFTRWPGILSVSLLWNFNFALLSLPVYHLTTKITIERFPKLIFFLIHFFTALVFATLATTFAFLDLYIYSDPGISRYLNNMYTQYFHICIISYTAIVSWFYFLHNTRRSKEQAVREANLKQLAQEAELKALKSQVNPHFLFNALNSINSLVVNKPEKTREMIVALADTLRYVLDTSQRNMVTLGEEIDFVKKYLAIEKIRFDNNLQLEFQIDPLLNNIQIPPVILQPLVENAVKHGISKKIGGGKITIHIKAQNESLICQVIDTGEGLIQRKEQQNLENGVGIKNIKERLKMIYGDNFSFSIKNNSPINPKGCTSTIKIPIE